MDFDAAYRLRGKLLARLRGKVPPQDAEDIVQEVYLAAYKNQTKYDPSRSSIYTWLANILRWKLLDHLRRVKTRSEVHKEVELADSVTPLDEVRLCEALANMPEGLHKVTTSNLERVQQFREKRRYKKELLG